MRTRHTSRHFFVLEVSPRDVPCWHFFGRMAFRRRTTALVLCLLSSIATVWTFVPSRRVGWHRTRPAARQDSSDDEDLWTALTARFQGDFDNYHQVVADRAQGLFPREGHEHIHCTLVPVGNNDTGRLAAFYFDGQPQAIFRFRYYQLVPRPEYDAVDTVLYTLSESLEKALRQANSPLEWPTIFAEQFSHGQDLLTYLPHCDVRWSWTRDPVQHAYVTGEDIDGIHAVMVHGSALVDSQRTPGQKILIYDQLSLWADALWIHDRGYDPESMELIYGNQQGVPYRLERVADVERRWVHPDLAWTLGPEYATTTVPSTTTTTATKQDVD